jgi:hypothetical protein
VVNLFGVRTLGEVAALSPAELFARSLQASYDPAEGRPGLGRARITYTLLGVVQETDAVAHILYRATSADIHYTDPLHAEILRAVRRGNRWLVRPDNNIIMFSGVSVLLSRMHQATPPEQ